VNRTSFNGPNIMSFCLIVVAAGVAITSLKWPLKTALFPLIISLCVLILALTELLLNLFGKEKATKKGAQVDFKFSEDVDKEVALRRTLAAFAWIMGFFVLILLFGFSIAVPLYVFLYVKLYGKERWWISLTMGASAFAFFYGLFVWLLDTPLIEGWGMKWLSVLMGI
jgi:hypothetical protein